MNQPGGDLVAIGRIGGAHGVRGQVRVLPFTDFPEHLKRVRRAYLGEPPRPVGVQFTGSVRVGLLLCSIEGIADREAAASLSGQVLLLPKSELAPLPAGHFYVFELIGLAVVSPAGEHLGKLADVERGAASDIYVLDLPDGRQARVPAVKAFVEAIDPAAGRIVIRPIPGLLE